MEREELPILSSKKKGEEENLKAIVNYGHLIARLIVSSKYTLYKYTTELVDSIHQRDSLCTTAIPSSTKTDT